MWKDKKIRLRKTTKDANKEIMIGGDNYPPFNYTDENGNMAGIDVELPEKPFIVWVISRSL